MERDYRAGGVWTFRSAPLPESRVVIGKIDAHERFDQVFSVSIKTVPLATGAIRVGDISHVPVTKSVLDTSLLEQVGIGEPPKRSPKAMANGGRPSIPGRPACLRSRSRRLSRPSIRFGARGRRSHSERGRGRSPCRLSRLPHWSSSSISCTIPRSMFGSLSLASSRSSAWSPCIWPFKKHPRPSTAKSGSLKIRGAISGRSIFVAGGIRHERAAFRSPYVRARHPELDADGCSVGFEFSRALRPRGRRG